MLEFRYFGQQMIIEQIEGSLDVLLGALSLGLVELHNAEGWEHPVAGSGQDFIVSPTHPLHHLQHEHQNFRRGVEV